MDEMSGAVYGAVVSAEVDWSISGWLLDDPTKPWDMYILDEIAALLERLRLHPDHDPNALLELRVAPVTLERLRREGNAFGVTASQLLKELYPGILIGGIEPHDSRHANVILSERLNWVEADDVFRRRILIKATTNERIAIYNATAVQLDALATIYGLTRRRATGTS